MATILITRPLEEVEPLAEKLSARGFTPFMHPMIHIEPLPKNEPLLTAALARNPQAILATSNRALWIASKMTVSIRDFPVFLVGASSIIHAMNLGLRCEGISETAQELSALVEKYFGSEQHARLLYLRGEDISTDIAAALEGKGFHVDSVVLYRAPPVSGFSDKLQSALSAGTIAGAMFFSRRTAATYAGLAQKHGLEASHRAMRAVCMSSAVAEELRSLPWQSVHIAHKPDMEHMLETMERITKP